MHTNVIKTSRNTARWLLRHAARSDSYRLQITTKEAFSLVKCIRAIYVKPRPKWSLIHSTQWSFWSWF